MKFADKAAEDYYRKLFESYGYVHINVGDEKITVEDLEDVKKLIDDLRGKSQTTEK